MMQQTRAETQTAPFGVDLDREIEPVFGGGKSYRADDPLTDLCGKNRVLRSGGRNDRP